MDEINFSTIKVGVVVEEYKAGDITVVIPTIGKDKKRLLMLLKHLRATSKDIKIHIVWDGNASPSYDFIFKVKSEFNCMVITHESNKGLSAARNTGLDNICTKIGMFIDDDIFPDPNWCQRVISFHNEYKSEMSALVGKVTWEGTNFKNRLTEWYEEFGAWSIFNGSKNLTKLSNFCGGFTSFKTSFFKCLKFNEEFTKYGCEDIEFGVRFFPMGGVLYLDSHLVGRHFKNLSLEGYIEEHIAAGYSKGLLAHLHPDDFFDLEFHQQACDKKDQGSYIHYLKNLAKYIYDKEDNLFSTEFSEFMSLLTKACLQSGYHNFFEENIFSVKNSWVVSCGVGEEDLYIPHFINAKFNEIVRGGDIQVLKEMQNKMPYFLKPFEAELAIDENSDAINKYFAINPEKAIGIDEEREIDSLNSRELYKVLLSPALEFSEKEKIVSKIIQVDPSFVSAYIWLLSNKPLEGVMREILFSVSTYFAERRPQDEKKKHLANIHSLLVQYREQEI
nr:glycosyltransferase [Pseudoalteromonas peptidolytica]